MNPKIILFLSFYFGGYLTVSAQNVGIGTLTPTEKLHVEGTTRITSLGGAGNALVLTNNTGVLSRTALSGNPTDVLDGTGTFVPISSITDGWKILGNTGTNPTTNFLGTIDAQDLAIRTNNTEKMRIMSGGNVGIGLANPANKLQILGASSDENTGIFRLGSAAANLRFGVLDGSRSWIQSHASLPLYINNIGNNTILNATDGADRNVGIGVTAPIAKLDVDFNTNNDFAAVKANGQFGPTRAYLGVQGKTDFDGITTADWNGNEIGVAGISTGGSTTDNYGVLGHSNGAGVRGEHSDGTNWTELGTGTRSINANGDAYVANGWLSVGGNTAAINRNGVYETTWQGNISFDENGYRYYDIGNFNYPTNGLPANVTVTKIIWEMDGYHEDANENHGVWIKLGTGTAGPWYGWFGNSTNGAKDVNWHYVSGTLATNWARGTVIRMRVEDDCCFGDDMRVFNLHIKIYYSYNQTLQDGDIAASGRIYANSDTDVGDMAEYFEVEKTENTEAGNIVVLNENGDNSYILSTEPYQQHIVGVISENPSVVLNNPSVGPPVALAGRVKVKLKKSDRLIKTGDFLTTSDEKGRAMLATKMGPVIGYAVSNQKNDNDYVDILVQPGRFYYPSKQNRTTNDEDKTKEDEHSRRRY